MHFDLPFAAINFHKTKHAFSENTKIENSSIDRFHDYNKRYEQNENKNVEIYHSRRVPLSQCHAVFLRPSDPGNGFHQVARTTVDPFLIKRQLKQHNSEAETSAETSHGDRTATMAVIRL